MSLSSAQVVTAMSLLVSAVLVFISLSCRMSFPSALVVMTMSASFFVLRGVRGSAFHLAETLQRGLVPVYVYDDVPWVPLWRILV